MIEVRDREGHLLYVDKEHDETFFLCCENVDLRKANFQGWNLWSAFFSNCDLRGAIFDDADLSEAHFDFCYLSEASLQNADMGEAKLECCEIKGADMRGANLSSAIVDITMDIELDALIDEGTTLPSHHHHLHFC